MSDKEKPPLAAWPTAALIRTAQQKPLSWSGWI